MARATGAELLGMAPPAQGPQDGSFKPHRVLGHGDRVEVAGMTLEAVHTPGHASNHLCYHLLGPGWLFTGDHIMGGSTVVIAPPDGDMTAYLQSLEALRALPLEALVPGHGPLMQDPQAAIDALIAHRLAREGKVLDALIAGGPGTLTDLVTVVYDDVPLQLHSVARLSLWAHLEKLRGDGRARLEGDVWTAISEL